jgi:hypothetical protein
MYWRLVDGGGPTIHYAGRNTLDRLAAHLSTWGEVVRQAQTRRGSGRRIHIFATFRYWIEHTCLLGHALSGLGHKVTLSYLPYYKYKTPNNDFDLRRQNAYLQSILAGASPTLRIVPLMNMRLDEGALPTSLERRIEEITVRDSQYSLREEKIDVDSEIFELRWSRNRFAAERLLSSLKREQPDAMIVPNGSVLEFAVAYQVGRHLDIPVVSYEFDEPRERIRLALNDEVMREDTSDFWQAHKDLDLTGEQQAEIRGLMAARQGGGAWGDFEVSFQDRPREGGDRLRSALGLDSRPVVLLAPNVFGDSATLGRQVFSDGLSDWVGRTVAYFMDRPEVQLIIRVHPSEAKMSYGASIAELIQERFPLLPEHIKLIVAEDSINTYDLIELADLGLVYTTTVGLEMALTGSPVIVAGQTHYKDKGFTIDPLTWEAYFASIDRVLEEPEAHRLSRHEVRTAWRYSYRFFFEFTQPFPWHLLHFWEDVEKWPLERVLSGDGLARFGSTFQALTGEPLEWMAGERIAHAR